MPATMSEIDAAEIRFRAERRVGEMMAMQPKNRGGGDGSNQYGRSNRDSQNPSSSTVTLASAGIDKNLAKRARKLAAVPAREFESMC
jgi:hypothetical protein